MILATARHIPVRLLAYDPASRYATVERVVDGRVRAIPFKELSATMPHELTLALRSVLASYAQLERQRPPVDRSARPLGAEAALPLGQARRGGY